MIQTKRNSAITGVLLILLVVATRTLPHWASFTATGSVALFSGYLFRNRLAAMAVVIASLALSDHLIGADTLLMRAVVYGSLLLPVLLGWAMQKRVGYTPSAQMAAAAFGSSVGSGLFFFLTTNFAVWGTSGMYEQTFHGLVQAYTAAIPFYRNSLAGDLVYGILLFGSYSALRIHQGSHPSVEEPERTGDIM